MKSFQDIGLNENIISGLAKQNIVTPTEIQSICINSILNGNNAICESHTGSGKTLAYLTPLFQNTDTTKRELQHLILAPTHELVMQIEAQLKMLSENSNMNITSLAIIGDVNIDKQIKKLKDNKPMIIVGSTGRVLDLIKKKKLKPHTIKSIVIDEADSLLDNTSSDMVMDLIKKAMRDVQILIFSASVNENTFKKAQSIKENYDVFKTTTSTSLNPNIKHYFILDRKSVV